MSKTGIARIDDLLAAKVGVPAIVPGDGDRAAVGAVQELLRSHGFTRLPDMRHSSYGTFGPLTRQSVLAYRAQAGLGEEARVDCALLGNLLTREPATPLANRCYLTQVLNFEWTPLLGVMCLAALSESGGRFDCLNLNTDRCGLSFGIIQWAQRPGRLHEILAAFRAEAPETLEEIVGGAAEVEGLLAHTARTNGGVNRATGETLDPRFDLVREPWAGRFRAIGRNRRLQAVQVRTAMEAFRTSLERLKREAKGITSQRGYAFVLDLANQHGNAGALAIYRAVAKPGMGEAEILAAMEKESVRRVAAQYGKTSAEAASTASRRELFRTMPWLSDSGVEVA